MASPNFRRLDKEVLLKMLSELALSSKNERTVAEAEDPEKKGRVESVLKSVLPKP
jgi:hypothetical protein